MMIMMISKQVFTNNTKTIQIPKNGTLNKQKKNKYSTLRKQQYK